MNIDKLLRKADRIIKRTDDIEFNNDDNICKYILLNKVNVNNSEIYYFKDDEIYKVDLQNSKVYGIIDGLYSFDEDVFSLLENKQYAIGYMDTEVHYSIWNYINDLYPEDINCKKGMQEYLKYCKKNNINKELIGSKVNLIISNDIMKYYQKNKERDDR